MVLLGPTAKTLALVATAIERQFAGHEWLDEVSPAHGQVGG